jgi:hypothetical protein
MRGQEHEYGPGVRSQGREREGFAYGEEQEDRWRTGRGRGERTGREEERWREADRPPYGSGGSWAGGRGSMRGMERGYEPMERGRGEGYDPMEREPYREDPYRGREPERYRGESAGSMYGRETEGGFGRGGGEFGGYGGRGASQGGEYGGGYAPAYRGYGWESGGGPGGAYTEHAGGGRGAGEYFRSQPGYGRPGTGGFGYTSYGGTGGYGAFSPGGYGQTWAGGETRERRGLFRGRAPKGYTRSDERIREEVNERLMQDEDLDPSEIEVTVQKGEVTLKGTVPDRSEKHRAEDLAEDVLGVKDVHNQIRVQREEKSRGRTGAAAGSEETESAPSGTSRSRQSGGTPSRG